MVMLDKTFQGVVVFAFPGKIMEEVILILGLCFPLFHTSLLIHKVSKGSTDFLLYLEGIDLVIIRVSSNIFVYLVIYLLTVVPEYTMGMGISIDDTFFNELELCVIWLSWINHRAVGCHIHILPNNIGKGYIPHTNTEVNMVPEWFSPLYYCWSLEYLGCISIILFSAFG